MKSLKKYKNQFETVANEPMQNSIDAQTIFENQRHRSLNVSQAAAEKRRNIVIKQNGSNSRNSKAFEPGTSRFKDNKTTMNQGSGTHPFQSSDATAPSEMPSDGLARGAKAAELHMRVLQSQSNHFKIGKPSPSGKIAIKAVHDKNLGRNSNLLNISGRG